ncbi:hypothetical protein FRB97_002864 [Tulasnella sp. 331]|nr:hypothetical protein FRB97_002864 [Tulasnella sp. 331]KAG8888994.1 hypothetical protein FRB98_006258 [Tulasnella sp. 332]
MSITFFLSYHFALWQDIGSLALNMLTHSHFLAAAYITGMVLHVPAKTAAPRFRSHHRSGAPNPTLPNYIVPLVEPPGAGYYVPAP